VVCTVRRYVEPDDLYSATRFRRFSSPTTGNTTVRTGSSGRASDASATLNSKPSLPCTRLNAFTSSVVTFCSARAPIRCTVDSSRFTSASVISRRRQYSNAASNAIRSSTGWSRV